MSNNPNTQPAADAAATQYITITVAEYVCLVKAAAMLEVIVNDPAYVSGTVEAVKAAAQAMAPAEAGAAK